MIDFPNKYRKKSHNFDNHDYSIYDAPVKNLSVRFPGDFSLKRPEGGSNDF